MALTKTLRFDDDVKNVIRNMVWTDDGRTGEITWQLDANLYKKVKKAFETQEIGGSWDKRAKVHRFSQDPRPKFMELWQHGTLTVARDGFFRTPRKVTQYILSRMALGMADYNWLEPSAGDGAIVKELLDANYYPERIYCIEQNPQRCQELRKLGVRVANGDFMKYRNSSRIPFQRILMNPPFEEGQDAEHVRRAYHHLDKYGVLAAIMGEGVFFRDDQKSQTFRAWLKAVGAYNERLPDKSFHESGTDVATRFLIVEK
jgi:hypothetical protein